MPRLLLALFACCALALSCSADSKIGGDSDASISFIDASDPGCAGCFDSLGNCAAGNQDQECGGNGETCRVCPLGDQCAENTCVTPPSCTPENCSGCCTPESICIETANQDAAQCGAGGQQCTSCSSGSCDSGTCVEECSPATCSGCCNGPTIFDCVEVGSAQSALECGAGGDSCQACGGSSTCTQGSCVDTDCNLDCPDGCCDGITCRGGDVNDSCGTGGGACFACGQDQTCSGGTCVVDPDSLWNFVVVNAAVPTLDDNGDSWDAFGGAPDPYVVVTLGVNTAMPRAGQTITIDNTFTPEYNETVLMSVPASAILDSIRLQLYDSDFASDDLMKSMIDNNPPEAIFGGGLFSLAIGEYRVRFRVLKP